MNIVKSLALDFINLFFPLHCEACGTNLLHGEKVICTKCLFELPKTNYHKDKENKIAQLFWGKVYIETATAYYFFNKGSIFQKLMHKLKYKGKKEIGIYLGKLLGAELKDSDNYKGLDAIIPIPLHPKRQKKRGYNQSDCIGEGLAEVLGIELMTNNLIRATETQTQTKKSKEERWNNVENVFKVLHPEKISGKHILLIDDVITTGATLEACARVLLKINNVKVSIACVAVANT